MEFVHCILCGSDEYILLYSSTINPAGETEDYSAYRCTHTGYGKHSNIVKCAHCGLVFANPRNNNIDILKRYSAVKDPLYLEERQGRVLTFENHLKPLHKIIGAPNGRRLLDIGAHIGIFVEIANNSGWEASGIEPSHWSVEVARRSGIELIEGTLASSNIPNCQFDVVTMWDVIEHLSDPLVELKQVYRVLKPGGWVIIHTMNIDSFFARLMGRKWPWFMEMHLFYFSQRTLKQMLETLGFICRHSRVQGRYLRLGYLASRLEAYGLNFSKRTGAFLKAARLAEIPVAINLGDLFTLYAQKPFN